MIAQTVGWPHHEAQLLQFAAPLHDVGKIGIPDSILLKPGKYTEVERKVMQRHCIVGAELLSGGHSDTLRSAESIALTHHEWWNGNGYPQRLEKDAIPIEGRIVAVADVFDALVHARPYKQAWTVEAALEEIKAQAGKQFDPEIVDAFLNMSSEDLAMLTIEPELPGNIEDANSMQTELKTQRILPDEVPNELA
jgi:putative two-component system response regulator